MCNVHWVKYNKLTTAVEVEVMIVEVWSKQGGIKVIHVYNPCKKLKKREMERIPFLGLEGVWCSDWTHTTFYHNDNMEMEDVDQPINQLNFKVYPKEKR